MMSTPEADNSRITSVKQCWRIATRYDKLAANYLAFVKLASIRIWLRAETVRAIAQGRTAGVSTGIPCARDIK